MASTFGPTANWDCHIIQWPWLDVLGMTTSSTRTNNVIQISTTPVISGIGGTQAYPVAAGTPLSLSLAGSQTNTLGPPYSQGSGRLIGIGVEVINTTAEIYKQGLVTVYRMPQPRQEAATYYGEDPTGGTLQSWSAQPMRLPPLTVGDALLYPGSRQWKASEGAYIVPSFVGSANEPKPVNYITPIMVGGATLTDPNEDDVCLALNNQPVWYTAPQGYVTIVGNIGYSPATKIYPIHMSGCVFSGLSAQSTLQCNTTFYYESFPSVAEDILVLAKPSATFDPVALSILSRCLNTLPVGVPAGMNEEGDWFASLVDTIAEWAPKIGGLMGDAGLPFASAIGTGIGAAAKLGRGYMTAPGSTIVKPNSLASEVVKKKRLAKAQAAAGRAMVPVAPKGKTKKKKNKNQK